MTLREDADLIVKESIHAVLPDEAVAKALAGRTFGSGKLYLVSVGKAGWQMAKAASDILKNRITAGVVVTKYDHVKGPIADFQCIEAGHPVPDGNSFRGTQAAIDMVSGLSAEDTVLFLISGGGSALFEKPLISPDSLQALTKELLASGADIVEMNTIRKRMSAVKGGRFAELCQPAKVYAIVLSDIIGDPLDMIASGPAYPDSSTCAEAQAIAEKYHLHLTEEMRAHLAEETPKHLANVETVVTGSVRELCKAAAEACRLLGYEPVILTDCLDCVAREAGSFLGTIAKTHQDTKKSLAFIAGGETIVHLTGKGRGGRNQELALSAAVEIAGLKDTAVMSFGSDGTDGPTDAAGGFTDQDTAKLFTDPTIFEILQDNNAYPALKRSGGLIMTGATGTNVNDAAVVLIKR